MEFIFELIGELVLELAFQLLVEFVLLAGLTPIHHALTRRRRSNPVLAAIGLVMLGGLIGLFVAQLLPERLLPALPLPGTSLVLSPLCAGLVMKAFGDWRKRRGGDPSVLATFPGGALFAFSFALVRWLMVGRLPLP
jgi:hypothetical protein